MKAFSLKSLKQFAMMFVLLMAALAVFAHAPEAMAQGLTLPGEVSGEINEDISQEPLGVVVVRIVNFFIGFLGFIAVIVFVYAGALWVLSGGNEEAITKAKKMMLYAALGLVVVLLSFSAVTFITSSAGTSDTDPDAPSATDITDPSCITSIDCEGDLICYQFECEDPASVPEVECDQHFDCDINAGELCWGNICTQPPSAPEGDGACLLSAQCEQGEFCGSDGTCQAGNDITCEADDDCPNGRFCDDYGLCRNDNAAPDAACQSNSDCASGFVCNTQLSQCVYQGAGAGTPPTGGNSSTGTSVTEQPLNQTNTLNDDLTDLLQNITDQINNLPPADREAIQDALTQSTLAGKLEALRSAYDETDNPEALEIIERLMEALEKFEELRRELNELREVMPESVETLQAWDETSDSLDAVVDDPDSGIKLRRFQNNYRDLEELIRDFPVVEARISATPAVGNVPFSVTLDGLNSSDPTGGTISSYKWSYLDNNGNEVSLGSEPVLIHEFAEPNTYVVRLEVSTSNRDEEGYKTATDGVATFRIRANPPSSNVQFRINGRDVTDVYHVTLTEAQAGLTFDPSQTTPAFGRVISEYEWSFGDASAEKRNSPATVVHSYNESGDYFVELQTTDNQGEEDRAIIKLTVKNVAADINITPRVGDVNTEFVFKGVRSRSDEGRITEFEWELQSEQGETITTSDEEVFSHNFDAPGLYRAILVVTDTSGSQDTIVKTLEVGSRDPVANFVSEVPERNHPNRVLFNAITSYDPDQGDNLTYSWDFDGDGSFDIVDTTDIQSRFEYDKIGDYRARLQVQDQFGKRDQTEKIVSIDSILGADIKLSTRATQVGEEVTFEVEDTNATAYLWEFGDGETESTEERSVIHTYSTKGKYNVKLNFFDEDDNDNFDTTTIVVGNADAPVAVIDTSVNNRLSRIEENLCDGNPGMIVSRSDLIRFDASPSINTDGTGRLLSYDWRFDDGSRNDRKEFTHKFTDINLPGECFEVSLAVRDQISGKISDADNVYFKVLNEAPEITDLVITSDATDELVTPTKVRLKAINPRDPDGTIKKYRWYYYREGFANKELGTHFTSTPETEMIITAEGAPDIENRYYFVVELTDSDNEVYNSEERFGEVSYLDIKNGPNLSPVVDFTMDKTTISAGDSITFISRSYDPQGDRLPNQAFQWDFDGDGQFDDRTSGAQVSRQFNTPGEYDVRLRVTHRGLSTSATKRVFVEATQSLPQAAFTYQVEGTQVSFNGGLSRFDPDLQDTSLRYEWDFNTTFDSNGNGINDDDIDATEQTPTYTYDNLGRYRVRLKVKDSLGQEGIVVREIDLARTEQELLNNSYYSLGIESPDQPITTLDVVATPETIERNGSADVTATVLNADGTPYEGMVYFEVTDGSGDFTPNPVKAINGKATSIFTGLDSGINQIRARATATNYGDLTEVGIIEVR